MSLSQLIYTSTCTDAMTPQKSVLISCKSVEVCRSLGLTGRVFANNRKALAMTEGPTEIVQRYFQAVQSDPLVQTIMLHSNNTITAREFVDYSVWLNVGVNFAPCRGVRVMTRESIRSAFPSQASARIRIMAEGYLDAAMLAS